MLTANNFAVILYEKDYPKQGSMATLIGIYPTQRAANFICDVFKEKYKGTSPVIESTPYSPTTFTVDNHLDRLAQTKKEPRQQTT